MDKVFIYGAYGYTGRLIVDECLKYGIKPSIAGRNKEKIERYASSKDLDWTVLEVDDKARFEDWLKDADVLIHCGGPFIHTAGPVVEACLATNTHYLDITGEFQVFDLVQGYDEQAKKKGLMLLPGAGFDVVPSDCLASHLKEQLPQAQQLILAFTSKGGRLSRGTTKTMIENLGDPQVVRKNGVYEHKVMGTSTKTIDFGKFQQICMGISWGDISTAFYSTGIPNIEVFAGSSQEQISKVKKMAKLSFILKSKMVKNFLKSKLDKKPDGPADDKREAANMHLWGSISENDRTIEGRLVTPNGYTLTANTSVLVARKILTGDFKAGYQTPATAYGSGLILEVEGCEMH